MERKYLGLFRLGFLNVAVGLVNGVAGSYKKMLGISPGLTTTGRNIEVTA